MSPNAEDLESARLTAEPAGVHQGRRVLPESLVPAQAWAEHEDAERAGTSSPVECQRLLPSASPPKSLQAGVTLNVRSASKKHHYVCHELSKPKKPPIKTKFQKTTEQLITALRPPYFIVSTIIVMVCVHEFGSYELQRGLEWCPGGWWQEPWRLITYAFVHANRNHLTLNALVGLVVGWWLELEQGWWRTVVVWAGGVAAGALGAGGLQPDVRVVGSSAAVYALLLAHLPNVCFRYGHIPLWWFRPLSVVVMVSSQATWAQLHEPGQPVAWAAHALGAAAGVPLAWLVFSGENQSNGYIIVIRIVSGVVLVAGVLAAGLYYGLWYHALAKCIKVTQT